MQELVLVQLGRRVGDELEHHATQADTRREFEERLAECGPLAYRVARGVSRSTVCAPGNDANSATRFGRSPSTSRVPRLPKTSPLRASSRRILIMLSRNCRKNCASSFCLRPWKATPSTKSPPCWVFPRARGSPEFSMREDRSEEHTSELQSRF